MSIRPGRLVTAMVTPFTSDGSIDYPQAARLAQALVESGSDGLVVAGTTGESCTLSWEEEMRLFREIKQAVGPNVTVIAGTGSNSTREAIEATAEAERTGVDACLLVVPYYNKPSQEGLYQHFRAIATSTGLPCILYDVPSRTITSLTLETVTRLSQIDNIIGIKDATGDFGRISQIISETPADFLVWSGNDSDTLPILALGGYGVISVASHLVGQQIKQMMDHFLNGNVSRAAALHRHLMPLFKALFLVSNPVPLKYALNYLGCPVGTPRLPLTLPDDKVAATIRKVLAGYQFDLPLIATTHGDAR